MAEVRLRQPEYTGENRCTPCTLVNLVIASGLAGLGAILEPLLGVLVLAGGLAAIYFRGYLVPGTPRLTKRYLPDTVLAWFDKAPDKPDRGPTQEAVDTEATLLAHELVEPAGDDLQLSESVRSRLRNRLASHRDGPNDDHVAALVGQAAGDLEVSTAESGAVIARHGPQTVGRWESRAALIGDLAAADVLEQEIPEWTSLAPVDRGRLASGVRTFVEQCPACDGPVSLGERTVESCCRSRQVYALTCEDCGARVLEVPQ